MSTSQGHRRVGARHRRAAAARAAALPLPAPPAAQGHRVRPGRRRHPGPLRRVRPHRRRRGRPAGARRAAAGSRAHLPRRAWSASPTTWPPRLPASGPPSATSRCWSRSRAWTWCARMEAEKGAPLDDVERSILDERVAVARAWLSRVRARPLPGRGPPGGPARRGRGPRPRPSASAWPPWPTPPRPSDRPRATPGRTSSSAPRRRASVPSAQAFAALYLAFLGRPNGPRAGWLLASLEPGFVDARLRAASAVPA